jgi:hypothetical protein
MFNFNGRKNLSLIQVYSIQKLNNNYDRRRKHLAARA